MAKRIRAANAGYYLAMQPPTGPVFISIPMDDWTRECQRLTVREVSQVIEPDSAGLDEAVRALNASRKAALAVGAQVEEDHGWEETLALAEHLNADVYQQPIPSRWTLPRTHRLFRGGLLPAQQPRRTRSRTKRSLCVT